MNSNAKFDASLPGDISASSRYFERDLISPQVKVASDGTVAVPDAAGLGFNVELGFIERQTETRVHNAQIISSTRSNSMAAANAFKSRDENGARSSLTSLEVRFAKSPLSGSRRRLIREILDNHEETFFLSSRELAKRYNVDAATIVRTVQALGYERFADFAADLRQHFVNHITPYTVLKAATQEKRSVTQQIQHCLERDVESLSVLRSSLEGDRAVDLAKRIHGARSILVVGIDLAASLAWFLAYGLTPLGFPAEAPVGSTGNLQHKIDLLTDKDLLVAISFGKCLRETVEAVDRARARGIPTFGITDSDTTPIALHCDDYLLTPTSSPSFTGSYVAPMALLNTIIVACAHLRPKRALAMLRSTEQEYRTGRRWYQEPMRRSRSSANGNSKTTKRKTKSKSSQPRI